MGTRDIHVNVWDLVLVFFFWNPVLSTQCVCLECAHLYVLGSLYRCDVKRFRQIFACVRCFVEIDELEKYQGVRHACRP